MAEGAEGHEGHGGYGAADAAEVRNGRAVTIGDLAGAGQREAPAAAAKGGGAGKGGKTGKTGKTGKAGRRGKARGAGGRRGLPRWLSVSFWGFVVLAAAGMAAASVAWSKLSRDADQHLSLFQTRVPPTQTKVLDNAGNIIGILASQKRTVIPYDDIPKAFQGAIVAVEDAEFWHHGGVSPRGFFGAIYRGVRSMGRERSGFSTLTMQLVRTVTERRERNILKGGFRRKLQEVVIARSLERAFSKQQIMEQYANEVNFGAGHYGIESASQYYFRKGSERLTIEESALLAAMVQRPSKSHDRLFSADPREREVVRSRRNYVISRMAAEGYLKEGDAELLKERPIRLGRENAGEDDIAAYAVEEVRKILEPVYGLERLMEGGLVIHTTIDSLWQQAATEAVQRGLRDVERQRGFRPEAVRRYENPETAKDPSWQRFYERGDAVRGIIMGWQGGAAMVRIGRSVVEVPASAFAWAGKKALETLTEGAAPLFTITETYPDGTPMSMELDQVPEVEGALLAIDPRTGEIRAMVGGYDFRRSQFNRSTQAVRQVGSTMKAFVYGAAMSEGMTPATLVDDAPILYQLTQNPDQAFEMGRTHYQPKNYERDFWGPLTLWESLAHSRNVPAVKTLERAGIASAVKYARGCGMESRIPPYPSLALGATDLTLRELTRGYATIAAGGARCPEPYLIERVVDRHGRVLEDRRSAPARRAPAGGGGAVGTGGTEGIEGIEGIDPVANFQLIQMLQGVTSAGTAAGTSALLNWPVAGKTGTTDDYTDAWFMGFSTRVACGVWVGMDTNRSIYHGASGARAALPIWKSFMGKILKTTVKEDFRPPPGVPLEWIDLDIDTGLRAGPGTRRMRTTAFRPGTAPMHESDADAAAWVRGARKRAAAAPLEQRVWGERDRLEDPPPWERGAEWEDPNEY
jgi:penicillin-binding protein 1A